MRLSALAAVCAALAGCAAPAKPPAPPPASAREIVRIPAKPLPARLDTSGAVAVEVRGLRDADLAAIERIREETRAMTGKSIGLSVASTAEAFLIPGFMSGSLVAGALILLPLAVGLDAAESRQRQRIVAALESADFQGEMRRRLGRGLSQPAVSGAATRLSAIVVAYGLMPKYGDQPHGLLCLVADVDLALQQNGRELYRDTIYLEPYRRSADAPPPVCASMERFASHDGAVLREAVLQYAEVIAAIARHRLSAGAWGR